jgi:hypothetical protein
MIAASGADVQFESLLLFGVSFSGCSWWYGG